MFQPQSEEIVSVGVASKRRCDKLDCTLSRVGGVASFHNVAQKPSQISCRRCLKTDGIVLVTQLFAPFTVDRSVYIYVCTHPGCAATAEGWIVFRNQALESEIELETEKKSEATPVAKSSTVAAPKAPATSIWSFDSTSPSGNDGDDIDDLLAMLEKRDESLNATKANPVVAASPSKISVDNSATVNSLEESALYRTGRTLPCYEIEDFDEEWDRALEQAEEDEITSNVDQSHISSLIESYLRDEEDREYATQLQQQLATSSRPVEDGENIEEDEDDEEDALGQSDDDDDDALEEANPRSKAKGKKAKQKNPNHSNHRKPSSSVSSRATQKIERYFQRRVSRHPSQVLRYAYGGSPLWSSALPPLPDQSSSTARKVLSTERRQQTSYNIPPCPFCGKERIFEFQLMPGMLSLWPACVQLPMQRLPANGKNQVINAQSSSNMEIDFGVVVVYTCPDSCVPPDGEVPYEYLLVQPAPDTV